ncbi:MAG: hypothetical protein IJ576_02725 [Synergistaceae bacterium]|nr:hypothetical protein [Synergistaceae bacterium]
MRVSILTNGPGELWGWARPVIHELKRRGCDISLWLLPCQYASGHEYQAAKILGADEIHSHNVNDLNIANIINLWRGLGRERADRVLQLGGDLFWGNRIAKANNIKLFCYSYGYKKGLQTAQAFTAFNSQLKLFKNLQGVQAIGDLVKDALKLDLKLNLSIWNDDDAGLKVLYLPGSRPKIRRAVLPWLAEFNKKLNELININFITLLPIFAPQDELEAWQEANLHPVIAPSGLAMAQADFAITQPGTNTLELMHSGLPALVIAPESFLDVVPLSGLKGLAAKFLSKNIKRRALHKVIAKWGGFISLPNRIANKFILDELYGDVSIEQIALKACEILNDKAKLKSEREELLNLSGSQGSAAEILCDELLNYEK